MIFNFNGKDARTIMEQLYIGWDLAKEDLNDKQADNLARIRDNMVNQYKKQAEK
jgi:vacuolar-type H+-ATPase subunit B/Vma2